MNLWRTAFDQNEQGVVLLTLLLFVFLVTGGCSPEPANLPNFPQSTEPDYDGTIVAVGDSLTEGYGVDPAAAYPAQLDRKLQADGYNYKVVNAGFSGETSSGAASRLNWILTLEPDIVILETGANDGLRGIDPALTEQNIKEMVVEFKKRDIVVVLAGMQTIQNLGQEYTTAFAEVYPKTAQEQDIILIPFFLEDVAAEPSLNQDDGIHPTTGGYEIVTKTVYPYVIEAIEQLNK